MTAPVPGLLPAEIVHLTPDCWTEPFWSAAADHRLVVARCADCGTHRMPPSPFCWRCRGQALDWEDHDGNGEVYSYTVIRHAVIPDVRDALPLVATVVELPGTDGCRLVANLVGVAPDDVRIGLPVAVDWYDVRPGTTLPYFRPR